MSLTATIATVDKSALAMRESFQAHWTQNNPPTASFMLQDPDSLTGYRPAKRAEVVISRGGTPIFGGFIQAPNEGGAGLILQTTIDIVGFLAYCSKCYLRWTVAAGQTTKSAMQYIVAQKLARYSITLAVGQATGAPSLPAMTFDCLVIDALKQIAALTGNALNQSAWLYDVSPTKVIEMFQPGTRPAAFDITDEDGHILGVPTVRDTDEDFSDYVIGICGDTSQVVKAQAWTGADGVHDGALRYFYTDYPAPDAYFGVWPNQVTISGRPDISGPVGYGAYLPSGVWYWDWANHRLAYNSATYGDIDHAAAITIPGYTAQYPFEVISDAGSSAPTEIKVPFPDCFDLAAGQALTDQERAKRQIDKREFSYVTRTDGLLPGQKQPIECLRRATDDDHLITDITMKQLGPTLFEYQVTAVKGDAYLGAPIEFWQGLGGGTTVSGVAGGGSIVVLGGGHGFADLGGSLSNRMPATGWQPVFESRPKVLHAADYAGGIATVKTCRVTSDPAVAVQLRVTAWNGSAWAVLKTGTTYTGSDAMLAAACEDLTITVTDGARHRLEINYLDDSTPTGGFGYVE